MVNSFPNYKGGFRAVRRWVLYCGLRDIALFGPYGFDYREEILDCLNGKSKMKSPFIDIHKEYFPHSIAIQCRYGKLFSDIHGINKKKGKGSITAEEVADWIINRLSEV